MAMTCSRLTGRISLIDMIAGQTYEGLSGGLYGGGSNARPSDLDARALAAGALIAPSPITGKIDGVFIGDDSMNSGYLGLVSLPSPFNASVRLTNCTNPAQHLESWASVTNDDTLCWTVRPASVLPKLASFGIAPADVQCGFFASAPGDLTYYTTHPFSMRQPHTVANLKKVFQKTRQYLPNLQLLVVFDIQYLGYVDPGLGEPAFGYDMSFGVREAILSQDPAMMPCAIWGTSCWADGSNARIDGLAWVCAATVPPCDYFVPNGNHLAEVTGAKKYCQQILNAVSADPALAGLR